MKNKSLLLRFGITVFVSCCFCLSLVSATQFHLNVDNMSALDKNELEKSIIPIHFADNWNDFGWFFYFSNGLGGYTWTDINNIGDYLYDVEVGTSRGAGEYYQCSRQVMWFYYNAERWERLWPLDQETRSGVNAIKLLQTEWWLYTRCEDPKYLDALRACENLANQPNPTVDYKECKDEVNRTYKSDGNWYYWEIAQTYPKNSNQKFYLAVWVGYNTGTKFVTISGNSKLIPTFIRFENKYPVWFIYDHNWGVGFVWCKINNLSGTSLKILLNNIKSPGYLEDLFYYDETESKIKYNKTDVDVECSTVTWDQLIWIVIEWIVWLWEENNKNNLDIILNEKDKKMQYFSTARINNKTLINYAKKKSTILCRWNSNADDVICWGSIGLSRQWYYRKTYIVNGNATIRPLTEAQVRDWYYYDLFVNGDLIIDENNGNNTKFKFTSGGFVWGSVSSSYAWEEPAIASLIRWNFIVNWNIKWTGTWGKLYDKYFIYWKLTTNDSFTSLLDTFQWRCNNWISTKESNGVIRPCPTKIGSWENVYAWASLVVIDQNYDSAFLGS